MGGALSEGEAHSKGRDKLMTHNVLKLLCFLLDLHVDLSLQL